MIDDFVREITSLRCENSRLECEKEQLNNLVNSCQEEIRKLKKQLKEVKEEYDSFQEKAIGIQFRLIDERDECCERLNDLLKENQKLKKQLEQYKGSHYCSFIDICKSTKIANHTQQKEFIKWLEKKQSFLRDEITELTLGMCNTDFQNIKTEVYQEVSQKYKEIIGDK